MPDTPFSIFCTSPLHLEDLVKEELNGFGARDIQLTRAGVSCTADLQCIYTTCLCSRVISRVLLKTASFPAVSEKELYRGALSVPWFDYFNNRCSILIHSDLRSSNITHSHYASQVVKDGIADAFRKKTGTRPDVDPKKPDIIIRLFLERNTAHLSIDLSGESLNRRGYRKHEGPAPLKEHTAAALLTRAGWPAIAAQGGAFIDLMCGSGTLPIEAALIAGNIPPGLDRKHFGFFHWSAHDGEMWTRTWNRYSRQKEHGLRKIPPILGFDKSGYAVEMARLNIRAAGLEDVVIVRQKELKDALPPENVGTGLVATNPPYGKRITETADLDQLYNDIGKQLHRYFHGWSASVITGDNQLAHSIGLKAASTNVLYNGNIKCTLAHFVLDEYNRFNENAGMPSPGARMFENRIIKNKKHLKKWLKEENISCYRLYDADMPEYAVALDLYENNWAVVQEYAPPVTIDPTKAEQRLKDIMKVLPGLLSIPPDHIFLKQRKPQRGKNQYSRQARQKRTVVTVHEGGLSFLVNLSDYIDTGLFLDHRKTRALIRKLAHGKRFLNLFAYTGSATVYAAAGGAVSTVTVDISGTYLAWARQNMTINGLTGRSNEFIRSDFRGFLESDPGQFDLIFIDPPTFSNRTGGDDFTLQKDHSELIRQASELLTPEGIVLFSNNYRKFRLDESLCEDFYTENITGSTIPKDFERKKNVHNVWIITKKQ